jgi:hypothetical protein
MFKQFRRLSKAGVGPKSRGSFLTLQLVGLGLFVGGVILPWKTTGSGSAARNFDAFRLGPHGRIDLSGYSALAAIGLIVLCAAYAVTGRPLRRSYRWILYLATILMVAGTGITLLGGSVSNISSALMDVDGPIIVWAGAVLIYWSALSSRQLSDREIEALGVRARDHARQPKVDQEYS